MSTRSSGAESRRIIGFRSGERQVVYYIPNGTPQRAQLGVAWADGRGVFQTTAVTSGGVAVGAWGPGSAIQIGPRAYALFVSDGRDRPYMEVRLVGAAAPGRVSGSVRRYEWETVRPAAVHKDAERNLWLLYYRNAEGGYGVMMAPNPPPTNRDMTAGDCGR